MSEQSSNLFLVVNLAVTPSWSFQNGMWCEKFSEFGVAAAPEWWYDLYVPDHDAGGAQFIQWRVGHIDS